MIKSPELQVSIHSITQTMPSNQLRTYFFHTLLSQLQIKALIPEILELEKLLSSLLLVGASIVRK